MKTIALQELLFGIIREIQNMMVFCSQGVMQVVYHLNWYATHQNKVGILVEIDILCGNGLIEE